MQFMHTSCKSGDDLAAWNFPLSRFFLVYMFLFEIIVEQYKVRQFETLRYEAGTAMQCWVLLSCLALCRAVPCHAMQ